jgi:hypothetical protein
MSRKTNVLLFAGAALGMGSTAVAGDLDLDRAYAAELRADAAGRTSLLQAGGGSGHDGVFHIGDASGVNRLNVRGVMQFRYLADFRDSSATLGTDNETTIGFQMARARLIFDGNVINENLSFRVDGDFASPANGDNSATGGGAAGADNFGVFTLHNAYATYAFEGEGSGWSISWGQMKAPVLYEEFGNEDWMGLAVERSIVNEFFTGGYTQGVAFGYKADQWAFTGVINDGANTANSPYNFQAVGNPEADFGLTARLDWKIQGDWAQFADMTSFRGSNMGARLGGGFHYQHMGETNPSFAATGAPLFEDLFLYTVDGAVEGDGWNIYAAFVGNHTEFQSGTGFSDMDDFGVLVQGGVFLTNDFELFGRYDGLFLDDGGPGRSAMADDNLNFLTVGGNYYFVPESHAAKFTGDVVFSFNDSLPNGAGLLPSNSTGVLGDISDGEVLLRFQMQLVF